MSDISIWGGKIRARIFPELHKSNVSMGATNEHFYPSLSIWSQNECVCVYIIVHRPESMSTWHVSTKVQDWSTCSGYSRAQLVQSLDSITSFPVGFSATTRAFCVRCPTLAYICRKAWWLMREQTPWPCSFLNYRVLRRGTEAFLKESTISFIQFVGLLHRALWLRDSL